MSNEGNDFSKTDHLIEILKARHEYGWAWFDFHAKQRTTIFNYFLVALALVINAFAVLMQSGIFYLALLVGLAGGVAAFGFWCLELRNRQLVHWGEVLLRESESDFLFAKIANREDAKGILSQEMITLKAELSQNYRMAPDERYLSKGGQWWYKSQLGMVKISHSFWFPAMMWGSIFFFAVLAIAACLSWMHVVPPPAPKTIRVLQP